MPIERGTDASARALCAWQVCDRLDVAYGGISSTASDLANHLSRAGARIVTISLDDNPGAMRALDPAVAVVRAPAAPGDALGFRRSLRRTFPSLPAPQIVHEHGLWRGHFSQASAYARRAGAPVIVTIHGMLHPPAFAQRRTLKRMARIVYQDTVLRTAPCRHATADEEADEIRAAGFDRPIAVIPWGVDMPDAMPDEHARGDGRRTLLFLGRLHPTKGLEPLLRAWAQVRRRVSDWRLVVAGYDETGYGATLRALAGELQLGASIEMVGGVEGEARERVLSGAQLLVLPSPSENFGLVVPEALARGVPVIATHGAPWPALAREQCGWWIPVGVEPLAAALDDALGRTAEQLRGMGLRGARFARARFSWQTVTASMLELYAWARGAAPEPGFVRR